MPDGLFGGGFERVVGKDQFEFVYGEQGLVLLDEGVPWLSEHAHEIFFIERVKAYDDGQATDQLGYESVFHEVVTVDVPADLVGSAFFQGFRRAAGVEPDTPEILEGAFLDDLVDALERAAADEQNVVGAYLDEFLVGVFASALRRDVGDAALDYLQKRLLNAFAGHVPGNRDVRALARNLVYFVYVDDAVFGERYVEVRCLYQPEQDVFHVFADVSGFGEGRGVGDGEGDFEDVGEGLGEVGLA